MVEIRDRRVQAKASASALRCELNVTQLATLYTLERFGWSVKFVRSDGPKKIAVLFDPDHQKHAILGQDGEVDENPIFYQFR